MWLIRSTRETYLAVIDTLRDFLRMAFKGVGFALDFKGSEEETAVDIATSKMATRAPEVARKTGDIHLEKRTTLLTNIAGAT